MAYAPDYNDDEEEENEGGEQIVGQSSEFGDGSGGSQNMSQGSNNPQKSSGSWTNLLSYVGANEGNDAEMGEKVKGGLENRAQQAQSLGSQYQTGANQKISENTVQDTGIADEVKTNASGIANDQAKKSQFDKQWDAYYNGPKDATALEGYQDAQSQYKAVEDRAKTAENYDGRYALLEDEYKRPSYSRGEKTLDSFILGAGQQGQQVLGDIKQNYGNYSSGWNDLVNQVGGNIQNAENTTNQTRQKTRDAVNTGIQNQESQFQNYQQQLANEAAANNSRFNEVQGGLRGDKKADYFDDAGLDADLGAYLSNMGDVSTLLSKNSGRKIGDLAQQQEIDNYNALLNLGKVQGGKFQLGDLAKSGNSADAFKLNNDFLGSARQAKAFQDEINAKVSSEQAKRDAEYTDMIRTLNAGKDQSKISQYLKDLGISQGMYQNARDKWDKNSDFKKYIKPGQALSAGNVMSKDQANSWAPLLSILQNAGFNPGMGTNTGAANPYYQLDKKFKQDFDYATPDIGPAQATAPLGGDELPWWIDSTKSDPVGTGTIAKTKGGSSVAKKVKKRTGI